MSLPIICALLTCLLSATCQAHIATANYRYVLINEGTSFDRCRNLTCEDGDLHSICLKGNNPSSNCSEFKFLNMTSRRKSILINGHNGIRNKIALRWGISNMLLLHWDRDLQAMARGYLTRCMIQKDSCNFIYNESLTIGQTFYYSRQAPLNRFVISIMRLWFLEANEIETFKDFFQKKPPNMTQMTYPATQFFGCAAAEMFGGHMMRCYYSPAADDNVKAYTFGPPCSACPPERWSCSRIFQGICGKDLGIDSKGIQFFSPDVVLLALILNLLLILI